MIRSGKKVWGYIFVFIIGASMLPLFTFMSIAQDTKPVYSVQVFSSKDSAKANDFAATLSNNGYSPVKVVTKGDNYAVTIGAFPVHADAVYYKKQLREGNFQDAFILGSSPVLVLSFSGKWRK